MVNLKLITQQTYRHRRTFDISLNLLFFRQLFYFPIRKKNNAVRPRNVPRKAPTTKTFSLLSLGLHFPS